MDPWGFQNPNIVNYLCNILDFFRGYPVCLHFSGGQDGHFQFEVRSEEGNRRGDDVAAEKENLLGHLVQGKGRPKKRHGQRLIHPTHEVAAPPGG